MGKIAKAKPANQKKHYEKTPPPAKKSDTFDNIIESARKNTKVHVGAEQVSEWKRGGWSHNRIRAEIGMRQAQMGVDRRLRDGVDSKAKKKAKKK
jgi:hypothetical protein